MTFGAALRQELRSLALAQRLLAELPSAPGILARLRNARLHVIGAEEEFRALKTGSHQDPSWAFLQQMRELGQQAGERWLAADLAGVGVRSTIDLSDFAGPAIEPHFNFQQFRTLESGSPVEARLLERGVAVE
jgi:NTE family protein